jgi:quercetin dioxygenase-like cupin family protein
VTEGGKALQTWDTRKLDVDARRPQVLRSDDEGRIIVINLPAGEELKDHQVHERAWIVVVDGEVELDGPDGQSVKGGPGLLAHVQPKERREIRAISDSRILFMLVPWPGEGHPSQRTADQASA